GVLLVFNPEQTRIADRKIPPHGTVGAGHIAFLTHPEELDAWRQHLSSCGVLIVREINWSHGSCSVYFDDPAGNVVEEGPIRLADRPLGITGDCTGDRLKIERVNRYATISLTNYDGPERTFTSEELARMVNGFVLVIGLMAEESFEAF